MKYRILPTKAQETLLCQTLDTLRQVYNSLLHERKFLYETTGKGIGQFAQEKHFTHWRKQFPELASIHSHLLQNVARRVHLAFDAFFRRVKSGETPGYPRHKASGCYDSFTFKEYGNGVRLQGEKLVVSKIGEIACILHRPLRGTPKTCTIRRQSEKWFACISCEYQPEALPESRESVGIDVGLEKFAALSDGTFVENPRFFRKDEQALAKAQRKLSKQTKGSSARRNARKVVSRIHERIRNRRHDFVHQLARKLVNRFGVIAVEKLNVTAMVQNHCLAKSISDASWSLFRAVLMQKAESAARQVVEVNPAYTSQRCSGCGNVAKKTLKDRWHECPICSLSLDRDTNAALNILADALFVVAVPEPSRKSAMGLHSVAENTA